MHELNLAPVCPYNKRSRVFDTRVVFYNSRLLTVCFILIWSPCLVQLLAWSHVLDYHIFFETPKNGSLKIHSLPSNNYFSYRYVLQKGVNALSKLDLKELVFFLSKSLYFVHFRPHDLVQACSQNTYQIV